MLVSVLDPSFPRTRPWPPSPSGYPSAHRQSPCYAARKKLFTTSTLFPHLFLKKKYLIVDPSDGDPVALLQREHLVLQRLLWNKRNIDGKLNAFSRVSTRLLLRPPILCVVPASPSVVLRPAVLRVAVVVPRADAVRVAGDWNSIFFQKKKIRESRCVSIIN